MKLIKAFPPNYAKIAKAFPYIKGRPGILYAYGDRIYNPSGQLVPYWIVAHEEVHGEQQNESSIETWWNRYIADPHFRLEQEIEAHIQEYHTYSFSHSNEQIDNYLEVIANRLASPLYGSLVSLKEARTLITQEREWDNVRLARSAEEERD